MAPLAGLERMACDWRAIGVRTARTGFARHRATHPRDDQEKARREAGL